MTVVTEKVDRVMVDPLTFYAGELAKYKIQCQQMNKGMLRKIKRIDRLTKELRKARNLLILNGIEWQ